MSMEIFFDAERKVSLNLEEEAKIEKITEKYWREYEGKDQYEGPGTFLPDGEDIIYSGTLRIPLEFMDEGAEGLEKMQEFLKYWLKWLSDVTCAVPKAKWDVRFEGIPLIWDEGIGWRMMSDQEFGNTEFR